MSIEQNKALMRRYHAAWEQADLKTLREMLADDCVNYNLITGEARDGVEFELATCQLWHESFSDVQMKIVQMVADGDRITVQWTLSSVHDRPFLNVSPTRQVVNVPGFEIERIVDGKIVEIWRLSDSTALMEQLRIR